MAPYHAGYRAHNPDHIALHPHGGPGNPARPRQSEPSDAVIALARRVYGPPAAPAPRPGYAVPDVIPAPDGALTRRISGVTPVAAPKPKPAPVDKAGAGALQGMALDAVIALAGAGDRAALRELQRRAGI